MVLGFGLIWLSSLLVFPGAALAKTDLFLSPASGSYVINNNFSVAVKINTNGGAINATEAYLTFDKTKFTVSSLDTSSSIFTAWPKLEFSNTNGTIHFAGGLPSPGFTGASGSVLIINFKGIALGTGAVTFDSGVNKPSVLLNDGIGTEDFGLSTGGSYTIIPPALAVSCSASPSSANVNSPVTFNANATGESGVYTYSWTGACVGTSASCAKTFDTTGTKTVTVTASSNGKTASANCSANIGFPGLNVTCSAPDAVDIDQSITFKATASGGSGSYSYKWSGACADTSSTCTNTYDQAGLEKATIKVTSDGKSASADCVFSVKEVCPAIVCPDCSGDKDQEGVAIGSVKSFSASQTPLEAIQFISNNVAESLKVPEISNTVKTISAIGVAAAAVPLFEGLLMPLRLLGILLGAMGLRKKKYPWGVVYDSVTKQPLDPAYVTLKYADSEKEIASSITDLDGRYGFFVDPEAYKMEVNKTNYAFPSKLLADKTKDELYDNLYFGGQINVKELGEVIVKNIPLDPVNFDWNEFAKKKKKLTKFYSQWDSIWRKSSSFIFYLGLLLAIISFIFAPFLYNTIVIVLYIIMLVLRAFGLKSRTQGTIVDKETGIPAAFAIIRVMMFGSDVEIVSKSADRYGRYYCLVPPGQYYVKIEKKNRDGSYSLTYTSPIIDVSKKGIIKDKFEI